MEPHLLERAREALAGWQRGDVSALEPLLDPAVELLWWEPTEWDCHGREAVLAPLRDRARRGPGRARVELIEVGDDALVVGGTRGVREEPEMGAASRTLVVFRDGKVISMRQFRGRDEALDAARQRRGAEE